MLAVACLAVAASAGVQSTEAAFAGRTESSASTFAAAAEFCPSATLVAEADTVVSQESAGDPSPFVTGGAYAKVLATRSFRDGPTSKNARSLIRFPAAAAPSGCTLTSATLRLHASDVSGASSPRTLVVRRASSAWSEATATWNTAPAPAGTATSTPSPAAPGWVQWTVTAQVAEMGSAGDHGFVLLDSVEDSATSALLWFTSREGDSTSQRPQLVLAYAWGSA